MHSINLLNQCLPLEVRVALLLDLDLVVYLGLVLVLIRALKSLNAYAMRL